ncbi:MAG: helix-turn-helix domain-containing protein [Desulfosarcina sp.]|nr:helix-turn-helix domain-containing protein [Desulfosarcina sp.]
MDLGLALNGIKEAGFFGDGTMETVGAHLKKEREAKNISLREISRLTKISELYLDYIEKDDFEKLPQGPYIKGYISSYSRLIGGDVDKALTLYDSLYSKRNQNRFPGREN